MKAAIIIPARYGSTRFPGKPLVPINGVPLILWTVRAASRSGLPVYVATDDDRIAQCVMHEGYSVIMTGDCRNGTERCAVASGIINDMIGKIDIVVNWQGDSPLMPPQWAADLADYLMRAAHADCATVAVPSQAHPGMVELVFGPHGSISDFRRVSPGESGKKLMHCGIYAYRRQALEDYIAMPPTPRETGEGLEQLRWPSDRITAMICQHPGFDMRECNEPGDIQILANMLSRQHETSRPHDRKRLSLVFHGGTMRHRE